MPGRRVLVTGASRGIGLGVARAFVEAGAVVWALAEDEAVHDAAQGHRGDGASVPTSPMPAAVAAALARVGALDVLVNNAGLERITPVDDGSPETLALFRRILDINVTGMAIVTAQALAGDGAGRADREHGLDLGPRGRAAVRRLRRVEARRDRAHQDMGEGTRAARHPGERRGAGLGADGGGDAVGPRSRRAHRHARKARSSRAWRRRSRWAAG